MTNEKVKNIKNKEKIYSHQVGLLLVTYLKNHGGFLTKN